MWSKYRWEVSLAEGRPMKWVILVNWSVTIRIVEELFDMGSSTIKSKEMVDHSQGGEGKYWRSPQGL